MNQLLLFEYLHADASAFRHAPASMRREGRAMLHALLSDAIALNQFRVAVVLCDEALAEFPGLPDAVVVHRCGATDDPLKILTKAAQEAHLILPVAPESDNLLLSVANALEPNTGTTLLPSIPMVRVCSDKQLTWEQFAPCGIPMLRCQAVPAEAAEDSSSGSPMIYKPRLGAGCEHIQKGRLPPDSIPGDFIQQPWIAGRSLSVALLGSPDGCVQLPVAEQHIEWNHGRPLYCGGSIPARVSDSVQLQIDAIAAKVMQQTGPFRGYLGLDLLLSDTDSTVFLNEINPRVCTSYVGYRDILADSPLKLITMGGCADLVDPTRVIQFHQ